MKINTGYISKQNTYSGRNTPKYIVIHETDNWGNGAGAKRHAEAQFKGHLGTSVHFYCGSDGVYQAADFRDGTYSIGIEYDGNHSVKDATNFNSINIEICVNPDGDYNVARANAIELVKYLIRTAGIPAERVIRHYDARGKYCPRRMMDNPKLWEDFKIQIGDIPKEEVAPVQQEKELWYRIGTAWVNGICQNQVGAYLNLDYAKKDCKPGYNVYDENGKLVHCGGGVVSATPTVSVVGTVITKDANLMIRSTPDASKNTNIIGTMPSGAAVTILEKGSTWHKVRYGGVTGYSAAEYIAITNNNVSAPKPVAKPSTPTFTVGKVYTLQAEMKVRTGPGTNYPAKKHSQLTGNGRKCDKDGDGALEKGTKVTCMDVYTENGNVWVLIPSGWVAAYHGGVQYLK